MKRLLFIINPISGKGMNDIRKPAEKILTGVNKDFAFTEYKGHASEITENAIGKNYDAIVSVGGDGTLNEVAKPLINTEEKLGIIPAGSGNGFARHLKIPISTEKSLLALKNSNWIESDVGLLNESCFLSTCGFGFDAQVAHTFSRSPKRGLSTYILSIIKEYIKYKPRTYHFFIDGRSVRREALILTLANASQYGDNAKIAPAARIDSASLLCCVIAPLKHSAVPLFTTRLLTGKLASGKNCEQLPFSEFMMENYTGIYHLDGEPLEMEKGTIHVQVLPRALKISV